MRLLVTGSRNWTDKIAVYKELYRFVSEHCQMDYDNQLIPIDYDTSDVVIVHGDCPTGVDAIVDDWAIVNWIDVERHPADWDKHGRAAGPIRNQEMVDLGADLCYAFLKGDSRGTKDCARRAEKAGIPVIRFYAED